MKYWLTNLETRCLAVLFLLALVPAAAAEIGDSPRSLVILHENAPGEMREFLTLLEEAGGAAAIVVPPRTAWVTADPAIFSESRLAPWIAEHHQTAIDLSEFAPADPSLVRMARVWNRFLDVRSRDLEPPVHSAGRPPFPDAGPIPVELSDPPVRARDAYDHIPYGAEYYDTSTYLAGSTAVGVWLLEADGSTYDWSTAEEDETMAGVVAGFDRWVTEHGGTMAFLSFFVEFHTGVPVSGVPIENPQGWDYIWIGEALTNAGWSGSNAWEQCFAYNNSIRDDFETNWAYSLFIVDSDPAVNQGLFDGGGYAWAYYGGPWIWMSRYSTWAYNSAQYFEAVPMHEMGHIFFATDEYDGFQQWSGYLNSNDNASTGVICLMNQNVQVRLCNPTKRQLGWRDTDGNGAMEPLDVAPDAALEELLPDPTTNPTPTWSGTANVNTLPNLNPNAPYSPPHDIMVATIEAVECRVDGGAWTPASPADGDFDAYVEGFTWTSPPLADGVHVVEARARTSVGVETTIFGSDTIEVQGSPVGVDDFAAGPGLLALHPVRPNPARAEAHLTFSVPTDGWVRLSVYSIDGSQVRTLMEKRHSAGAGSVRWDGFDERGRPVPSGVYLYRLETAEGTETRKATFLR